MNSEKSISVAVKILANKLHRYMTTRMNIGSKIQKAVKTTGITEVQGQVIGYVFENGRRGDIYQKDIEEHMSIRRSTATIILQRMEKADLITREVSAEDARLKAIRLTSKAKTIMPKAKAEVLKAERQARNGLTDQELATFFRVIDKISLNIE